jgi:hypothetical protein
MKNRQAAHGFVEVATFRHMEVDTSSLWTGLVMYRRLCKKSLLDNARINLLAI